MNQERVMQERKCFGCGGFGHTTYNCRNRESRKKERLIQRLSNKKFEVLTRRVVNVGEQSKGEIRKDRKTILSEERLKKEKKKERKEKKERPVDV